MKWRVLKYITIRCNVAMVERPRNDVTDGYSWSCPKCKTRKSVRDGSFLYKVQTNPSEAAVLDVDVGKRDSRNRRNGYGPKCKTRKSVRDGSFLYNVQTNPSEVAVLDVDVGKRDSRNRSNGYG